jgi:hypothetical protein
MNKVDKQTALKLDKFYTNPIISKICYDVFVEYISKYTPAYSLIEPSAGDGAFLFDHVIGFDLCPELPNITKHDFLDEENTSRIYKNLLCPGSTIGNPPFGKKGSLATQFVNLALKNSNFVGFILPIQFRKYSCQSKINPNAKLVLDYDLPDDSFLLMGEKYDVRCCFQIWTLREVDETNLRLLKKPMTSHPDFEMYQYNRTEQAEKFFDYDWDFAVVRQGYHDYSDLKTSKDQCNRKQQWIFFKAKNPKVLTRLKNLDFGKLSRKNTSTPGFGKADVVEEYTMMFE